MTQIARGLLATALGWSLVSSVRAEEPYQEFLDGLRDRQYYDYALFYIDQLAARPQLPLSFKQALPFERAVTLMESARASRNPEKQSEQLDQALAFLDQFVKESPDHPRAGEANSQRADILLNKARVEIVLSRSPANQGNRAEFQKRAREYVGRAREVFKTAQDQHEAAFKKFASFIDKAKEPDKYEAREKANVSMIRAQLDLAQCTYEEAQTYDAGSPDYKRLLNDAAAAFEDMHQRHRTVVAGLFARVYQGKCFEEQGDLQKALGIYNEMLAHPGDDGAMTRLKDQTLQFKLICLNSKERGDHQLVVDLGEEWLKKHAVEARTRVGLGIRWEVARALEMLGDRRELPKSEAQRIWREAREQAQQVNRFPGEFRDVSMALMQRLDVKIGGKERLPDKFDTAFGLGRTMVTAIKDTKDALDASVRARKPAEDIKKQQQDLNAQLVDAAKMLELALRLATRQDDPKSVTQARFYYAYVNFQMRRNYEAAILGEYVALTADKDDSTIGSEAAYLAMIAYIQAFNDNKAQGDSKDVDMSFIVKAANLIVAKWPDSDKANDARLTLGRMYSQLKRPVQAAEWYGKVPAADPKFPEAQLASGQAYWTAYLSAPRMAESDRPNAVQLADWQRQAQDLLRNGIAKMSAAAPKEGAAPGELIAGKMSLSQILIALGQDLEAIKLLLDEPQSVIKAVTVADEAKRPDKGVQSRVFATETYKLLLRAYIGGGKLDEARDTMKTLEKVAGGGSAAGADVTELYVGLGKLLREELDRFKAAGETARFQKLMTSFETFLNDLYQRKDGQTFGSLSWIGETYFALGEAMPDEPARAVSFFDKSANAYQQILSLAEQQPDLLAPEQMAAVKVRLVRSYRLKKDFEAAERLILEVLSKHDKELGVQSEAALVYQDWGASGGADTAKKLLTAMSGQPDKKMWGWRQFGVRVQKSIEQGRKELLPQFVESHLQGATARHQYALAQTSPAKRREELDKAEAELVATVTVAKGLTEEQLRDLNKRYHQILQDGSKPIIDLKPSKEAVESVAMAGDEPPKKANAKDGQKTKAKSAAKPAEPETSNFWTYLALGGALLGGGGVVAWKVMRTGKHGTLITVPESADVPTTAAAFDEPFNISIAVAPVKPRAAPAAEIMPRPAATKTAASKPASSKSAGASGAPAKPKPKPPA